jgi:hypothetical protein
MVARRLLIVLAVLLGLTALAAAVAPRHRLGSGSGSTPAVAATPAATAGGTVDKTLDAGATGQRVVIRVGQTLELTVKSDTLETVNLEEYGDQTAEPDSPALWEVYADAPGNYAITLDDSGARIGTLEIRGAG